MFKVLINDFKMAMSRRDNKVMFCLFIAVIWFVVTNAIVPLLANAFSNSLLSTVYLQLKFPEFFIFFWNILFFPFEIKGIFSFIGSMFVLSMFGNVLSEFIGGKKFFSIFLISGFMALATFVLLKIASVFLFPIPNLDVIHGGITFSIIGVIFAIMALSPTYEISIFSFSLKLIWVALIYILFSCIYNPIYIIPFAVSAATGHYYILHMKGDWALGAKFANLFKKKDKKAVFTVQRNTEKKEPRSKEYFPTQSEIDKILDKISNEGGYDALSADEKEKLKRASSMKE